MSLEIVTASSLLAGNRTINDRKVFSDQSLKEIEETVSKKIGFPRNKLHIFTIGHIARRELPYGRWECKDGRVVWFNREYQPIIQVIDGVSTYADRNEWVKDIVKTTYVYDDFCAPHDYLSKHLGVGPFSTSEARKYKHTLLCCLKILRDITPKESGSVQRVFSLLKD